MRYVMLLTSKWSCPLRHFVLKMFLCLSLDTRCLGPSVWYQYYTGHSCFARLCLSPFNLSSNENCSWTGCRAILIRPGHLPTRRWPQWCVLRPSPDTVGTELRMRWSADAGAAALSSAGRLVQRAGWALEFKSLAFVCEEVETLRSQVICSKSQK